MERFYRYYEPTQDTGSIIVEEMMAGDDRRQAVTFCQIADSGKYCAWIRIVVVIAALSSLSLARSIPTVFPNVSSVQAVSPVHSAHDQRPRFDNEESPLIIPTAGFSEMPLPSVHAGVVHASAIEVPTRSQGAHYTRPPPL